LEHTHLLFRVEMRCCVDKRLIESNLLLPVKNKLWEVPFHRLSPILMEVMYKRILDELIDAQVDLRASWHNLVKIFWALDVALFDLTSALPLSVCSPLSKTAYMYLCLASKRSFSGGSGLYAGSSTS